MNTFSPELPPSAVIKSIAQIGYVGCDLSCDGAFYPYSSDTVECIKSAASETGVGLANINSMTTAYFWRDLGDGDALRKNRFRGPDFTDSPTTYADFGVSDPIQWRLDRIESCMRLAAELDTGLLSTNAGSCGNLDSVDLWPQVLRALNDVWSMARIYGVQVCIETEEDLFVSSRQELARVWSQFPTGAFLWGFDVGHQIKHYQGDHRAVIRDLRDCKDQIGYFHIEDISRSDWEGDPLKHRHLTIGEGDIDFIPILDAICEVQDARLARGEGLIPLFFENYTAFDTAGSGSSSSQLSFNRLNELLEQLRRSEEA